MAGFATSPDRAVPTLAVLSRNPIDLGYASVSFTASAAACAWALPCTATAVVVPATREAGLNLRIGSELSSNEAIKQTCIAGFGPAYLSLHTCLLEMKAGLLALLPMPRNTIEREWFVAHSPSAKQLPQVAFAFERFLRLRGQMKINQLTRTACRHPIFPVFSKHG